MIAKQVEIGLRSGLAPRSLLAWYFSKCELDKKETSLVKVFFYHGSSIANSGAQRPARANSFSMMASIQYQHQ